MSTSLDIYARAALEARRGEWRQIADASGVSYSWLSKFANRRIQNPGFGTLKALHAALIAPRTTTPAQPDSHLDVAGVTPVAAPAAPSAQPEPAGTA